MLINMILESFIIAIAVFPFYLLFASFSLEHHSKAHEASQEAIQAFLDQLKFPFNFFFTNPRFNWFTARSGKAPVEHLTTNNKSKVARNICAVLASAFILTGVVGIFNRSEDIWIIRDSVFIAINLIGFYLSWRFGKKLILYAKPSNQAIH